MGGADIDSANYGHLPNTSGTRPSALVASEFRCYHSALWYFCCHTSAQPGVLFAAWITRSKAIVPYSEFVYDLAEKPGKTRGGKPGDSSCRRRRQSKGKIKKS